MITGAWDRFWVAGFLWFAIIVMLECVRLRQINRLPWWIIHGPVIAWGGVALLPWFIALSNGIWPVPAGPLDTVPLDLPKTYGFTLIALIGIALAVAPFAVLGRRVSEEPPNRGATRVVPRRVIAAIAILVAAYLGSLPSLSSLWVVSGTPGEDLYSNSNGSFLSLSLVVLTGVTIGYLARQQRLSRVGMGLYLVLLLVTLGSAHRYLVMILVMSYLILRHPFRNIRVSLGQGLLFLLIGASAVWLVGFAGLGHLSVLRSGTQAPTSSVYTKMTLSSFDVMGAAEFLLESGVQPAGLHGASYLALPGELIPRVILGSRATPPAAKSEQNALGTATGASAPLWMEGVLNLGGPGDLVSMVVVTGLWGLLLRRAVSSQSRLGKTVAAIGPAWILFAYQALSRILMIATIDLFASIIVGLLIWNWMQIEGGHVGSSYIDVPDGGVTYRGQSTVPR
jgi:hypothetical protein